MENSICFEGWKGRLGNGLAERELSCLLAVAAGMTDKQIAQRDGLSPRSIKARIESAMFKLNAFKRPQLVAEAMKRQIIAPLAIVIAAMGGYQSAVSLDGDHQRRGPSRRVVELRILKARDEAAQTV